MHKVVRLLHNGLWDHSDRYSPTIRKRNKHIGIPNGQHFVPFWKGQAVPFSNAILNLNHSSLECCSTILILNMFGFRGPTVFHYSGDLKSVLFEGQITNGLVFNRSGFSKS